MSASSVCTNLPTTLFLRQTGSRMYECVRPRLSDCGNNWGIHIVRINLKFTTSTAGAYVAWHQNIDPWDFLFFLNCFPYSGTFIFSIAHGGVLLKETRTPFLFYNFQIIKRKGARASFSKTPTCAIEKLMCRNKEGKSRKHEIPQFV